MERSIIILRLPNEVKSKLQAEGFNTIEDIERFLKSCNESQLPPWLEEIFREHKVLQKMNNFSCFSPLQSAADHLLNSTSHVEIFHQGLSNILRGGLPVGQITELCGPPGSGKTQFCLQFCVDVQIPQELGGTGGEALYISTDFGFHVERLTQIARGTIKHFTELQYSSDSVKKKCLKHLSLKSILHRVKVSRIYDLKDLYEVLGSLKNFFEQSENIKLVIVDSFSLPLMLDMQDTTGRTKTIAFFLSTLLDYAVKHKFAVVLTNQLVTVLDGDSDFIVKPALGQAYAHRIHQRLILRDGRIYVSKNITQPQIFTYFTVRNEGIR